MSKKQALCCAVCGKEYASIVERANCELLCSKRVEEEAKKAAEAKKRAEKTARLAEIDAAYAAADKLVEMYVRDFGIEKNIKDNMTLPDFLTFILNM